MTLTTAQSDTLRQQLETMKQRVQSELKQKDPAQFAHLEIGDASIDDTLQHEAMSQYLHQHAEWEALQRASARLAENIADVCKECGESIPFGRLEVEPTAERCIRCQGELEADDRRLHLNTHSSM